ncbi:hypothetical protein Scep_002122 [Stephania cephalantha]|uniref:Uncharacterized protein n=1 Tax=Stephania cephalantha TaxID=152367 RepID=A0AAP0Q8G5_9MAGN
MWGALIAPSEKALSAHPVVFFAKPTQRIFSASVSVGMPGGRGARRRETTRGRRSVKEAPSHVDRGTRREEVEAAEEGLRRARRRVETKRGEQEVRGEVRREEVAVIGGGAEICGGEERGARRRGTDRLGGGTWWYVERGVMWRSGGEAEAV